MAPLTLFRVDEPPGYHQVSRGTADLLPNKLHTFYEAVAAGARLHGGRQDALEQGLVEAGHWEADCGVKVAPDPLDQDYAALLDGQCSRIVPTYR